jgi:hypothetical protein
MSRITNKHIIKIKELLSDEVCMGTYRLVELELLEMEKDFLDQIQNKLSNSDYAKCADEICRHLQSELYVMQQDTAVIEILRKHFA